MKKVARSFPFGIMANRSVPLGLHISNGMLVSPMIPDEDVCVEAHNSGGCGCLVENFRQPVQVHLAQFEAMDHP